MNQLRTLGSASALDRIAPWVGALVVGAVFGYALFEPSLARPAIAVSVAVLLISVSFRNPALVVAALLVWLPLLGLVRRLSEEYGVAGGTGDPLLLVEGAAVAACMVVVVGRGAFSNRTPLATAVLVLQIALIVTILNPLQGSPLVGLGGALIVIVPMFAFWIGRTMTSDRTCIAFLCLIVLVAVVAAIYGLVQSYSGFPFWDDRWIQTYGYEALNVGGAVRPFASFVAASDFAIYLVIGIVIVTTLALYVPALRIAAIGVLPLLAYVLWIEGSRGAVVTAFLSVGAVLTLRTRLPLLIAACIAAPLLVLAPIIVDATAPETFGHDIVGLGSRRQVEGLSDPFGDESTFPGHLNRVLNGITSVAGNPIGNGVGSISTAADRLSGVQRSTEGDISNAAVAAGIVGLVAYLLVLVRAFIAAWRWARETRSLFAVACVGILVATFGGWLTGGNYACAFIAWLALGWVDRFGASVSSADLASDS